MSRTSYRTALVIGLGASGRASVGLLCELGVAVRVYDRSPEATGLPSNVHTFLGEETPPAEAFAGIDLMVLSPGVPPGPHRALCAQHAPDAQIHGELSLALETLPAATTVLITGTNGKSTVTAMLGHLMTTAGREPFVGGNLGDPPAALATAVLQGHAEAPKELVLECSSYQLETLRPIPTAVAMVLNVTPDHLARYDSMEHYALTKARVFNGMADDGLSLLDAEDAWTPRLTEHAGPQLRRIGPNGFARIVGPGPGETLHIGNDPPYDRSTLRIPGRHNAKNALFAIAAARHLGIDATACARGLATFEGLPHRMAFVREHLGVRYYNDSKATNVASALASLSGLSERFVLIAGGQAKGDDLAPLQALLRSRGRGLVTIGESGDTFADLTQGQLPTVRAETMEPAVEAAAKLAQPGDVVVLAPACASWDQFRSYAHRGDVFAQAVLAL